MVNASTQKSLSSSSATIPCVHAKFIAPGSAQGQAMAASTAATNANIQTILCRVNLPFSYASKSTSQQVEISE